MHAADGKVGFPQLLSEPVDLSTRVAEHNGLRDCETTGNPSCQQGDRLCSARMVDVRIVEIEQGLSLEIFLLDGNEELLDSLEGQLITLDQNPS